MRTGLSIAVFLGLTLSGVTRGDSGVDLLIQAGGSANPTEVGTSSSAVSSARYVLDDALSQQLFAMWRVQTGLPLEVNLWMEKVLSAKYEAASLEWGQVSQKIDSAGLSAFAPIARSAWLYSLWKLELKSAFMNEWLKALARKEFTTHPVASHVGSWIAPYLPVLLEGAGVQLSSDDVRLIGEQFKASATLRGPELLALFAWSKQRAGSGALEALEAIPPQHFAKAVLSQTVVLDAARKNDLATAGRVLKQHLQPALDSMKDASKVAAYHLQIARLLYQAGAMEEAQSFFERIPRSSPAYLKAREENIWILLRKGDLARVRGEIASLKSPLYAEKFFPEVELVRAVSNLRLCLYEEVEKDLAQAQARLKVWAKSIDAALAASSVPAPSEPDEISRGVERWIQVLATDMKRLESLTQQSVEATLADSHWASLSANLSLRREEAKKTLANEHRRQWQNARLTLSETIKKLRFVKVEYLTRLKEIPAITSNERPIMQSQAAPRVVATSEMTFLQDGLFWPDELFRLRSTAQSRCTGKKGVTK
jgi:hypothetical protein